MVMSDWPVSPSSRRPTAARATTNSVTSCRLAREANRSASPASRGRRSRTPDRALTGGRGKSVTSGTSGEAPSSSRFQYSRCSRRACAVSRSSRQAAMSLYWTGSSGSAAGRPVTSASYSSCHSWWSTAAEIPSETSWCTDVSRTYRSSPVCSRSARTRGSAVMSNGTWTRAATNSRTAPSGSGRPVRSCTRNAGASAPVACTIWTGGWTLVPKVVRRLSCRSAKAAKERSSRVSSTGPCSSMRSLRLNAARWACV